LKTLLIALLFTKVPKLSLYMPKISALNIVRARILKTRVVQGGT
jgi:hypothetical protein